MSRTYRRKKGEGYYWTEKEALAIRLGSWGSYSIHNNKEEYKKAVRLFYSDKQKQTMNQVPKWYKVTFCRRPYRRMERRGIICIMQGKEEVMFDPVLKDAMYYW